MVRISGTLSSNVSLSSRMQGGQSDVLSRQIEAVQKLEKPTKLKDREPDMTFAGIGRKLDIRA